MGWWGGRERGEGARAGGGGHVSLRGPSGVREAARLNL